MSFDEVCQLLMREPFAGWTFAAIAELTDYQISEILFKHPADEPETAPDEAYQTPEEIFRGVWARRGLSDAEVEEKWRAECKGNPGPADGGEAPHGRGP